MGCEQIMTFDELDDINNNLNNNQNSPPPKTNNLLIRAYAGVLTPGTNFSDTIIKSNIELNEKLRNYIPSQIKKDNSYTYNLEDDILTKSEKVNFQDEYIIAINGVNKVIRVEEFNGDYLIFHDNQPKQRNAYIALVVKKISGSNPRFTFASPKRPFLSE